jgi:catechol 2,3-dioxygenase-like lactoylglutathione lyase family enzyme
MPVHSVSRLVIVAWEHANSIARLERVLGRVASSNLTMDAVAAFGATNACLNVAEFALENTRVMVVSPSEQTPQSASIRRYLSAHGDGLMRLQFGADDIGEWRSVTSSEVRAGAMAEGKITADVRESSPHHAGALSNTQPDFMTVSLTTSRGVVVDIARQSFADSRGGAAAEVARDSAIGAGAVDAVDHVVVRSGDADASRQFYEQTLGIRVALDRRFEAFGARLIFCRISSLSVEIAAPLDGEVSSRHDGSARDGDYLHGLAFRVADADRAAERLVRNGETPEPVRDGRKKGTRVFGLMNPPANIPMLFIQQPQRSSV